MRFLALTCSVLAFLVVASATVSLQVRAAIRAYQVAREEDETELLHQQQKLLVSRVQALYPPSAVRDRVQWHRLARLELPREWELLP